ncbi:hypothetical protein LTR85_002295 [Meristemomyces frigidus]|nr:hypothetical protein LTR85_002295 [Meristemomyces frigidus]
MAYLSSSSDEMLLQYDKMQGGGGNTLGIAALLLSVAMTVQQALNDMAVESISNTFVFVKQVSDAVERIVISDDVLAGTLQGLETALLFIRLPPITQAEQTCAVERLQRQKASLWETICAIDRITCMTWSLPLATADYPPAKGPIMDDEGQVIPRNYLYSLADIASRVFDLENIHPSGAQCSELFNAVMSADRELRLLASLAPKNWWRTKCSEVTVDTVLQHWHHYLTIRVHLQLALKSDEDHQYAFNFITCLEACQELARRYVVLRPMVPTGFFGNRVLDLQVFSAAVFLLLASYRTRHGDGTSMRAVDLSLATALTDQVVQTLEYAADRTGGDFARQAAGAIRSLNALLERPQTSNLQKITLHLPLVGKISVSRKSDADKGGATVSYPPPSQPTLGSWQINASDGSHQATTTMPSGSVDIGRMDSLSYSLEVPEAYPFLNDEAFGSEEWLTWTGWDGIT